MVGRTLGHYRLLEPIGSGGMGVVYRARDLRLERGVALKVLPEGTLGDEAARRRFRHEALALSQLNHPNIATVHDFDRQEGVDFLVLEHIEGETLDVRLGRGALAEREVAKLGAQLAAGLEAAHRQGVVHRDLKPGNLRVTPDGRLKILDFGLARLVRPLPDQTTLATLTDTQTIVGTLPYMAPEQLAGERADARSDLYSAGAVLYEMATGRRPFPQSGAPQLMYAIMNEAPEAPSAVYRGVSPGLESVILKALEKDPELRYQSARELRVDLERASAPSATRDSRIGRRRKAWRARPAAAVLALGVVALAVSLWVFDPGGWRGRLTGGSEALSSLAVLPLSNLSGDPRQEYFADGMTDELITSLGKISALTVIARSSIMEYKGRGRPLREIARALKVGAVLEGSVLRAGEQARVSVQLIAVATGRVVWSESYERSLRDVIALQSEVALAIAREIQVKLTPQEQSQLSVSRPVDPEAHEAYLRGRYEWNRATGEGFRKALRHFELALEKDSRFAPAYAGLADAYSQLSSTYMDVGEAMPRARAAALQALALDSTLAAAHAALAHVRFVHDYDWPAAEKGFRRALELNPGEVTAHQNYGYLLLTTGRFALATRELRRAREIDPLSPFVAVMNLWPLNEGRRYDEAVVEAEKLLRLSPDLYTARIILAQALFHRGERQRALQEFETVAKQAAAVPMGGAWLGWAYGRTSRRREAERILAELASAPPDRFVQPYARALVLVGLDRKTEALEWLEKGVDGHTEEVVFIKVEPALDPLRSDPRFEALLRRLGYAR